MQNIINGYYDELQDQMYMEARHGALINRNRVNPPYDFYECDEQFKARYSFNKVNCAQLTNLVQPFIDINRNNINRNGGCDPRQTVCFCSGLEVKTGGHFFPCKWVCLWNIYQHSMEKPLQIGECLAGSSSTGEVLTFANCQREDHQHENRV